MDRAKLEEAIKWGRVELENFTDRPIHNVDAARKTKALIDAAEAHLATLPKTKMVWGVSAGCGWVHFDDFSDAMNALETEARGGKRPVTIERREVPA